jgi:hypothetical protein
MAAGRIEATDLVGEIEQPAGQTAGDLPGR